MATAPGSIQVRNQSTAWNFILFYVLDKQIINKVQYLFSNCNLYYILAFTKFFSAFFVNIPEFINPLPPRQENAAHTKPAVNDRPSKKTIVEGNPCPCPSTCIWSLCVWAAQPKEGPIEDIPPS